MSAKKNDSAVLDDKPAKSAGGLPSLLRANIRWIVALAVIGGGCAYGWKVLWEQVREHVVASPDYRLDSTSIEITPLPEWIHADLKAEVVRDASLDGSLSTLDPELTMRIAQAFRQHAWVAKVDRVSKQYPAAVKVELVYRRPVAMVEVPGPALLPVDAEGVVLPTEDFSPLDARHYPRIGEIKTSPSGPVGTRWGDTRVSGGALVAAAIAENWEPLALNHIVPSGRQGTAAGVRETDAYELYTKAGTRIDWGRPPGAEISGEAPAASKIASLVDYAAKHGGSLDDPKKPQRLDVRPLSGLIVAARPAIQALPKTPVQLPPNE
jgi:hypothetical protein